MRHISLDLIRVTEAAAIAASKWVGSGNKELADKAATDAMRHRLNNMDFAGKIVIGEGEKDESYGLYSGEFVGKKESEKHAYEIAVDPIEGTTPTVTSGPEAISTIAVAKEGSMYHTPHFYMKKLAVGPEINSQVQLCLNDPLELTMKKVRSVKKDPVVCILNRPRHDDAIKTLRDMGVRIKLIQDCDVSGAIATCLEDSGVDIMYGIGGAPEAVLTACAIKSMGGDLQGQIALKEKAWASEGDVLGVEDLVKGECIFVATGITNGSILRGVRQGDKGPITNSVFMRSASGTVRWLTVHHGN